MFDVYGGFRAAVKNRFEGLSEVGRGGTSTVFRARDRKHDRWVALKVLDPSLMDAAGTERFVREITITSNLQHPHILPLLDSGRAADFLYLVTPLVEGPTLRDRIMSEGRLPVRVALMLALEIADAIAHAHRQGVIHLDLKPANILISDGHAMVADFGVARASAHPGVPGPVDGFPVGTPEYMSPEQIARHDAVGAQSDVYGLGCLLFEMLTGRPPFEAATGALVMSQHLNVEPPSARQIAWGVPVELDRLLARMLAKDPEDRSGDAGALADELAAIGERRMRRDKKTSGTFAAATAGLAMFLGVWGYAAFPAAELPRASAATGIVATRTDSVTVLRTPC